MCRFQWAKPHQRAAAKLAGDTVEDGALADIGTADHGDGVAVRHVEQKRGGEPRSDREPSSSDRHHLAQF